MLVLGIESSCDDTGAALVDETGLVHADIVQSQVDTHALYGGVVPELASRDHMRNAAPVVRAALTRAKATLNDVDGVAVTNRPGLVGALLVGVQTAKGLAWALGKPLVGVDHLLGHMLAVFLRRDDEPLKSPSSNGTSTAIAAKEAGLTADREGKPRFPYVCLLASGGHTAIYRINAPRTAAVMELGATRDDAAGEAFDKVAKRLGLGYPGGPAIERWAARGNGDGIKFLAPMASGQSLEMSFSGLKTQFAQHVAREPPASERDVADLCAAFQSAVTEVLARKTIAAAVREQVADVVLGGGVAANLELRRRTIALGTKHGIVVHVPPIASCTDNAAMIAYAGMLRLSQGENDGCGLEAESRTAIERRTRKGGGRR